MPRATRSTPTALPILFPVPAVEATPRPTDSPWGRVDNARQIIPGVWKVSTGGHGGVHVSADLQPLIPESHRARDGWYEEDQEWSIPWTFLDLPRETYWKGDTDHARNALRHAYPDLYEARYGVTLQPGESHAKDHRAFMTRHADDYLVTGALSTCHNANIGKDQVGIVAERGGQRRPDRHDTRYYLVPRSVYDQPRHPYGTLVTDEYVQTNAQFIPLEQA
ncbi:DUF7007 domain-containing protein [Deinococcus soli (ex Cha et al. 2016)]|uniref:DUF7007 domain-containing protein n=2 Tax=Deinococcus soli (ex Cha et al. 2016) TaxID=1309411 RepID=A0AAE3XCM6_9DEIO|nr:hypothetical protein [Deinococcus soli (ex Cha et al. 2016)]MDR6218438.1 hypothetical protein [Deinococcus soli (ex Cha et al. 2016)]MDR6329178.1 hypothetical protein [Deinococcus soli (ex Cha et al. 2016)]MDR6751451.1 hypothetical protein [Deinococcus soli (ex Cha et al. 2016)]